MVKIRLSRSGAKKKPFYHIVVTDSRNRCNTQGIECIGYYNPLPSGQDIPFKLDQERFDHWYAYGARPSPRVANLMKKNALSTGVVAS